MSGFVNFLETVLTYIVQICIILMEFAGVCVLAVNAVRASDLPDSLGNQE